MRFFPAAIALFFLFLLGPAVAADDPPLVSWRDQVITRSDYEAALANIPERDRHEFQSSMRRITDLLNGLLLTRTLAAEGRKLGLDKDPGVAKQMALAGDRLLAARRIEAFEKSVKVPDMTAAAEERYRIKPGEFREHEQVRASHILIDARKRPADEARARAEEVRGKVVAGGDFARLAVESSDDPSVRDNGGDLGWFGRGRMAKPFEEAAFALEKPDDISPVVQTQFGFHVIKLAAKKPGRQKTFDEVKDALIAQLKQKYIEAERNRYLEGITQDKSIVIHGAAVDALKIEAPKAILPPIEPEKKEPAK